MAAANPLQSLQEEVTCSICLEYYKDPVFTKCAHNFCRSCIAVCPEGSDSGVHCPQCREVCPEGELRPNRQLQSMVELVKQLAVQPGRALEQSLCEKHDEKQKLFCKEDEDLMCVICRESREHRSHTALPIDEAAHEYKGELQACLQSLKEELGDLLESKLKEEEGYKAMMKKLITDKLKMVAEFDGLRQLLKDQEETLLMRLEKMERSIKMAENANEGKYSSKISFISDLIAEMEKKCEQPPLELLKDIRRTLSRCRNATPHLSEGLKKKYKED
ncbi:E3 ubiquitin-protein ligase TRIM39-like isoform X2 [Ambystoma mexicanum]|uniref:E3 ubiquitin-protein ligase TRIM39-like isoform X2 n=1 Tax=Ambystoma mexicanum TaxID=8296 RepID=UPI0037E7CF68